MKFINNKKLNKDGFTLVEVLAAVMVLSIGLIGSLTLITYNLRNISLSENKVVASGLAEDGLERVRNIRDTNWLKGAAWDTGFDISAIDSVRRLKFFCGGSNILSSKDSETTINSYMKSVEKGGAGGNWTDNIDQNDCNGQKCKVGIYKNLPKECYSDEFGASYLGYTRQNPRIDYWRLITAKKITADSILVTVVIKWVEGVNNKYLTVTETLYNWQ